jgi:Cysteine dioxygenase type I
LRLDLAVDKPDQISRDSADDRSQEARCRSFCSRWPAQLSAIASGLAKVTLPWELRTGEVPTERRYERLLTTPVYEAWVICWPAGTGLDLHDHGGPSGAFAVVSGELDETTVEDGDLHVRHYGPGTSTSFGAEHVHAVANRGELLATSVHVYSSPLDVMD